MAISNAVYHYSKLGVLSIDVFATIQSLFAIMSAITAINVINIFAMRPQVET